MLGGIVISIICCFSGIKILLLKYKEKGAKINFGEMGEKTIEDGTEMHDIGVTNPIDK